MPFAKPEPGHPVVLKVGGKSLELRFSFRALKELDADHNISVLKGDSMQAVLQDPVKLALVLYYGLRHKYPYVTLEWVEDNFDSSMLIDLMPAIAYAATGRWVELNKEEEPKNEQPLGATGSRSGRLAATTSAAAKPNSGA